MVKPGLPLLLAGIAFSSTVQADDEALPDMAFLEYLGMWDEADEEEWQLLDDEESLNDEERSDPVPDGRMKNGEESMEKDDES